MRSLLTRLSKRQLWLVRAKTAHSNCVPKRKRSLPLASEQMLPRPPDCLFYMPFSTTSKFRSRVIEQNKNKAQKLLDERLHSRGQFTGSYGVEAKEVLDFFKEIRATDAETVTLSIAMIERIVKEKALCNYSITGKWVNEPSYFMPLFYLWKEATEEGERVISPLELARKLQKMSSMLLEFRYNIELVNMIMEVAMNQAPPRKAPLIAEEMYRHAQKEAFDWYNAELQPNVLTYNYVLQAWAVSGLSEAPAKMDALLQHMREEGVEPDATTNSILQKLKTQRKTRSLEKDPRFSFSRPQSRAVPSPEDMA